MKNCNKRQIGFTLIELMLVIAIIASISVIGIAAYHQRMLNFQVDKTALQMQQWLEGATAFYVNCNQWPGVSGSGDLALTSLAQLQGYDKNGTAVQTCNKKQGAASAVVYVAKGSINNDSWGQAYLLKPPASASQNFQVATLSDVPANLANRIVAQLPNAQVTDCTKETCAVVASITAPSQGSGGGSTTSVVHMEVIPSIFDTSNCTQTPNTCIKAGQGNWPSCASGYTAHFYATPSQMNSPITDSGNANRWVHAVIQDASQQAGYWEPQLNITPDDWEDTHNYPMNYMLATETCEKSSAATLNDKNIHVAFKY